VPTGIVAVTCGAALAVWSLLAAGDASATGDDAVAATKPATARMIATGKW